MKSEFYIKTEVEVRFKDVDMMGHVNNANYLTYFEQGRVAYFRQLFEKQETQKDLFPFVVAEITIRFVSPAFFDETLVVGVRTAEMGTKSFRMEYEIKEKKSKRLVATGHSVQVMYDYQTKATFPIPESLKEKIRNLF